MTPAVFDGPSSSRSSKHRKRGKGERKKEWPAEPLPISEFLSQFSFPLAASFDKPREKGKGGKGEEKEASKRNSVLRSSPRPVRTAAGLSRGERKKKREGEEKKEDGPRPPNESLLLFSHKPLEGGGGGREEKCLDFDSLRLRLRSPQV